MKTAIVPRYLPVLFALLVCGGGQALAQTDAERIRALEERVAHLERMVDALTQARDLARDTSENNTAGSLRESVAELVAPGSTSTPASTMPSSAPLRDPAPQELLPNLGKIGAAAFLDAGLNTGPFSLGREALSAEASVFHSHWRPEDASITRSPLRWRRTTVSFL